MEVARIVLAYLEALAWPVVVGAVAFAFRGQLAMKIRELSDISTPLVDAKFDHAAKEIEVRADLATARQETKSQQVALHRREPTEGDDLSEEEWLAIHRESERSQTEWAEEQRAFWAVSAAASELMKPSDFDTALEVAAASPSAAVLLAYSELEQTARAAWTISRMRPEVLPRGGVPAIVAELASGSLDEGFVQVARDLAHLRNRVAHGAGDVSPNGALDFIAACEQLARPLGGQALSRLRHPIRATKFSEWTERFSPGG